MRWTATLIAAVVFAMSMPSRAETVRLGADLRGHNEVPANTSTAQGRAVVDYDTATRRLTWRIEYKGLTTPLTAAHFHGPSAPDKNAGVRVPIVTGPSASPLSGNATLTDEQAQELLDGRWYINVHTATHPAGEIRGQVMRR